MTFDMSAWDKSEQENPKNEYLILFSWFHLQMLWGHLERQRNLVLKKKTTGILDLLINFYVSIFLSFCGVLAHVLLLYSVFQGDEKFKS